MIETNARQAQGIASVSTRADDSTSAESIDQIVQSLSSFRD